MIILTPQARNSLYAFSGIVLGAGWVAFGLLGDGNTVFLAVMIIASMVIGGGLSTLVKTRA